jgi:hypothetical protein
MYENTRVEMTVEIGCRGDTLVAFQHHSGANDGLTILVDHRANDRGAVLCHDRESWADHHRAYQHRLQRK